MENNKSLKSTVGAPSPLHFFIWDPNTKKRYRQLSDGLEEELLDFGPNRSNSEARLRWQNDYIHAFIKDLTGSLEGQTDSKKDLQSPEESHTFAVDLQDNATSVCHSDDADHEYDVGSGNGSGGLGSVAQTGPSEPWYERDISSRAIFCMSNGTVLELSPRQQIHWSSHGSLAEGNELDQAPSTGSPLEDDISSHPTISVSDRSDEDFLPEDSEDAGSTSDSSTIATKPEEEDDSMDENLSRNLRGRSTIRVSPFTTPADSPVESFSESESDDSDGIYPASSGSTAESDNSDANSVCLEQVRHDDRNSSVSGQETDPKRIGKSEKGDEGLVSTYVPHRSRSVSVEL